MELAVLCYTHISVLATEAWLLTLHNSTSQNVISDKPGTDWQDPFEINENW